MIAISSRQLTAAIGRLVLVLGTLAIGACSQLPPAGQATVPAGTMVYGLAGPVRSPVVVLQSGLGDGRSAWGPVWAALSDRYRVFAPDRPGYGDSPATTSPRDPCTIAHDLHAALRAAEVPPPYLLLGHSIGGLYQFAFARLYPQDTAGLLLLDPTHPAHWATMQRDAPAAAALLRTLRASVFTPVMRAEFDAQAHCLEGLPTLPSGVPVQVVFAGRIGPPDNEELRRMVARLRQDWERQLGVKAVTLANAGHYVQRDDPDRVVREVEALVRAASLPGR